MEDCKKVFNLFIDKNHPHEYEIFVPFKVSPFGTHSDHQHGSVTGFALEQGLNFYVSPTPNGSIQMLSLTFEGLISFNLHDTIPPKEGNWGDFLRGSVQCLKRTFVLKKGIKGVIKSSSQVSSISPSAALMCGFIMALAKVNDLALTDLEIIKYSNYAERQYIGLHTGIIDQGCIVLSEQEKLLCLNTKTGQYERIPFGNESQPLPFEIAVISSGMTKYQTTQNDFNLSVDECKVAAWMLFSYQNIVLKQLKDTYLGDLTQQIFLKHKEKMGKNFQNRAQHFFEEQKCLIEGVNAWKNGDIEQFGRIVFRSCENSIANDKTISPELISFFQIIKQIDGVYGGKFNGSGFKGHFVAFIDPSKREQIKDKILNQSFNQYPQHKQNFQMFFSKPSSGVKLTFHKNVLPAKPITVVILAAGYATRLYPLTQNFPKPLLPIGNTTILDLLMKDIETIDSVTECIIVTNDKYHSHFEKWLSTITTSKNIRILNDDSNSNENRLGAVNDLLLAIEKYNINQDIFVMAADNILDFSLKSFIDQFLKQDSSMIMYYEEHNQKAVKKTGIIVLDNKMQVIDMEEKPENPKSNFAVPAFYAYNKKDLILIKNSVNSGCERDAPGNLVKYLYQKTPIKAWKMIGTRTDIGTKQTYEQIQKKFQTQK